MCEKQQAIDFGDDLDPEILTEFLSPRVAGTVVRIWRDELPRRKFALSDCFYPLWNVQETYRSVARETITKTPLDRKLYVNHA